MSSFEFTISRPKEIIDCMFHMEDNYPGIIEKAYHEKMVEAWSEAINPIIVFIYTVPKEILAHRRLTKLVDSFSEKAYDFNPRKKYYIDKIAKKLGIPIPETIKPRRDYSNIRLDTIRYGLKFETSG